MAFITVKLATGEFACRKLDSTKNTVAKYKATLGQKDLMFGYIWFGKFKLSEG